MMNIVIATSKEYAKYAPIMLVSLFENNKDKICLYLLYDEDMEVEISRISEVVLRYNNKLVTYKIDEIELQKLAPHGIWHASTWYRWKCVDILSEKCDRLMLMGVDMIITGDISEYYYQDLGNKCMAATKDSFNMFDTYCIFDECSKRGMDPNNYVNSEAVVIDLKKIRGKFSLKSMMEYYCDDYVYCMDQGILNYYYSDLIKIWDDYKYNFGVNVAYEMFNNKEYLMRCKQCVIYHFGGIKPWNNYDNSYAHREWLKYAKLTSWYEDILNDIYMFCIDGARRRINQLNININLWEQTCIEINNGTLEKHFVGVNNIALYGAGKLGLFLKNYLVNKGIKIECLIDKKEVTEVGVDCLTLEQLVLKLNSYNGIMNIIVIPEHSYEVIKNTIRSEKVKLIPYSKVLKDSLWE